MKIKNKLYLATITIFTLVLLLGATIIVTSARMTEENKKNDLAMELTGGLFELNILTYEYALHHEARMIEQWNIRYNSMDWVLSEESVKSLHTDYFNLKSIFEQLTENYDKKQKLIHVGASQEKISTHAALEERLTSQILIKSKTLSNTASIIAKDADDNVNRVQKSTRDVIFILLGALLISITLTSYAVVRSVARPINDLIDGTIIIGKGRLNHKIDIKSKDEIGALAVAFNKMADKLNKVTVSRDSLSTEIIEREKAELKLKELSKKNELVLDAAGEGIYGLDLEGKTTFVNPAAAKMIDWEVEDILGKSQHDLLHHTRPDGTPYEREECPIYAAFKDGEVHHVNDEVFWRKDGSSFPVEYISTPIRDEQGKLSGAVVTFNDITRRKKAEDELENHREHLTDLVTERTEELSMTNSELKNEIEVRKLAEEELKKVNEELGSFSYSVSHDLRAPLRAINGFSSAVLEDYASMLDVEGKRYLSLIEENSRYMGKLIDDILNFSRLGSQSIQRSKIDIEQLVKSVYEEQIKVSERKIKFTVKKLPLASGDHIMVRQVFVNLINNAIKFTSQKKNAAIEIGAKTEEGQNIYYVKDNGVGFDMKYVNKLWGVFQRLHNKEDFEGTGVGLAIVQRIVNRHGGHVWAEGKVGKGATFYFTIHRKKGGNKHE